MWQNKAATFAPLATNPDHLRLGEDSFTEIEEWNDGPTEDLFLARCSIADLVNAESRLPDESYISCTLSRATLVMGSKDNQEERDDESSTVRLASELISGILRKEMHNPAPSASGLAAKFVGIRMTSTKILKC